MTAEKWRQVKELFERANALEPEERRAVLEAYGDAADEVRREVEVLLATPEPDEGFLEVPPDAAGLLGLYPRRLGPYEITRMVGAGGTATVYEAFRRDGHYEQRVAIKLVRAGMDSDVLLRRLQTERQILAGLNHPNIARLFDGGATPEGTPYLVLEFIEGLPITTYCDRCRLPLSDRLALFEQVCAAVQHAHRNLVVHRDIKPGNVLVTEAGTPKLLDFGIARLLDPGQGSSPETGAPTRMLTPEYASPEQILGEPITTSTDVYSLGVLLYELLSGRLPYQAQTDSPLEILRLVCEGAPEKPSAMAARTSGDAKLGRALEGDLDNIVLKAMSKEPERRYLSVEQLAGDIRRFLEGRPVLARGDSLAYRTAKFVRRNLAASIAAALLLVAVTGGTGATLWQAGVANQERVRAERRFGEVRQLARNTLFELDEAIRKLPGSTSARALLTQRTVELLDGLAADVAGDFGLQLELSEAYRRLSRVQGSVFTANLGDRGAAVASGRKALALAEAVMAMRPGDPSARSSVAQSCLQLAGVLSSASDRDARASLIDRAIQLGEALTEEMPNDAIAQLNLAAAYERRGAMAADPEASLGYYHRSIETARKVLDRDNANRQAMVSVSFSHKRMGAILIKLNRLDEAAGEYSAALALDERVLSADPKNPESRYSVTFSLSDIGYIHSRRGDLSRALDYYQRALDIREALAREDPQDARALHGVASTCNYLAGIHRRRGEWAAAIQRRQRAIKATESILKTAPDNLDEQVQRGWQYLWLGQDLAGAAKAMDDPTLLREATTHFRLAIGVAQELQSRSAPAGDLLKSATEELGKLVTR